MITKIKNLPAFQVKRTKPANLKSRDVHLFQNEFERTFPEVYTLKIAGCMIFRNHVFRGGYFFEELTHNKPISAESKAEILRSFPSRRTIIEKAKWITDNWSVDYFHWMTDCLGRLILSQDCDNNADLVLPQAFKAIPFVVETLAFFKIQPVFLEENQYYEIRELWLPSYPAPTGNFHPLILQRVRAKFQSEFFQASNGKRIYISRSKAAKRKILNESELILIFEKFDFEHVCLEELSVNAQVELFSRSSTILGLHGGGLTNMMFMPKGGTVIEIRNHGDSLRNCFFAMASELDLKYYYFLSKGSSEDTHYSDFIIDIPRFEQFLTEVLG